MEPNVDQQAELVTSMYRALGFSPHLLGEAQRAYGSVLKFFVWDASSQ
jgi:hypothetical protein